MKKIKRLFSMALTVLMLFTSINVVVKAEENVDWSDVQRYYPFSSWAVDIGIKYKVIFLENNRRETKRYEVANILFNISSLKENKSTSKKFSDISDISETLQNRILSVANAGMVQGYEDGTFKPNNNVTRAEFVTMLSNSGILQENGSNKVVFSDTVGHWAEKSINKIASLGIVTGKGENKFCPEENITPQEIFVILDRLVEQKSISKEKLIFTVTDTFQSKVYGEKEQYIIETMYSKFDKVQNDIKYTWPYEKYYNPENWQELATYNDLKYALYFGFVDTADLAGAQYYEYSLLDRVESHMFDVQGIKDNYETHLQENFNIRNMLYAIKQRAYLNTGATASFEVGFKDDQLESMLNFSNIQELSAYDKATMVNIASKTIKKVCFENNEMYFPMDAPVTKYMLNYTILNLQEKYDIYGDVTKIYKDTTNYGNIAALFGGEGDDFETDESKLPYNYNDYPFIIKGIPKEVYERPFAITDEKLGVLTPREGYTEYRNYEYQTKEIAATYFDTILNVDYRTINVDEFASKVNGNAWPFGDMAKEYAQYVIDNKIILKGKGYIVPGTMHIIEPYTMARVVIQFEVISADNRVNLLYGDSEYSSKYGEKLDVKYTKDKYTITYDTAMGSVPIMGNFSQISEYRIYPRPIISDYYYDKYDMTEMP